ncbi:MAG: hypothetical protein LBG81_08980 [Coriobacteriaceae bacterium]|nr:hypothetical protein [Coriobacteriaceae bacterium]
MRMKEALYGKLKGRVIIACLAAVLGTAIFATPAFAGNTQYYFDFQKGDLHICGPGYKDDNEQYAYISVRPGDTYFIEGSSAFGNRIRTAAGEYATTYAVYNYYGTYAKPYYPGYGYTNGTYMLYGMVDESSGTQWIRIWGYWCP